MTRVIRAWPVVAVAGLSVLFWVQGERFIAANGPTFDEAVHLAAGHSYWTTGDFRLNIEDPPLLKLLWALPAVVSGSAEFRPDPDHWATADEWSIGQAYLYDRPNGMSRLATARRVNLALGVSLVWLTGWWAYRVWASPTAGVVAAALTAVDPTVQALSGILSTDLGLTLTATAAYYLAWEFAVRPTRWALHLLGLAVGLALGAKFSGVVVVASLLGAALLFLALGGSLRMPGDDPDGPSGGGFGTRVRAASGPFVRVGLIAGLTLVPIYFVVHFPDWGAGLKQQLVRHQTGDPWFYFSGEVSNRSWLLYFPVALLLKLPAGTVALIAGSALLVRVGRACTWPVAVWLAVAPGLFVLAMMVSGVDVGVRVVLPAFPAMFVAAARLATGPRDGSLGTVRVGLAGGAVVAAGVAGAMAAPYQLTFFNVFAGGPESGIRYLGDSNLDWGQGLPGLKEYQDREQIRVIYLAYHGTAPPRAFGIRYHKLPAFGGLEPPPPDRVPAGADRHVVAVSATCLQGIYMPMTGHDPDVYRWLLDRKPTAVIGHAIYVYDLTDDPDAIARVRRIAAGEARRKGPE